MKKLTDKIVRFFRRQSFVIVSTIGRDRSPHNSCKGIVKINRSGRIYLLDLYKGKTFENLKQNPHIAITAADEHRFIGYCLKGKAGMVSGDKLTPRLIKAWEARINKRITQRLIENVQGRKGHPQHPEALFPKPEYMIVMETEEVVDLTPHHLRR